MGTSILLIALNAIVYLLTSIYFYKKDGLTIHSFLWFYISLFALGSVNLLRNGLYFRVMESHQFSPSDQISIVPYILCYILNFIMLYPIRKIRIANISYLPHRGKYVDQLIDFVLIIEILYLVLKMCQMTVVLSYGLGAFHDLGSDSQNQILYGSYRFLQYFNYLGRYVNTVIMPMLLAYQLLAYKNHLERFGKFKILFYLFCLNSCLVGLVAGSRATITFGFLNILFFCILFKNIYPRSFFKKLKGLFIFFLAFFLFLFVVIALQRMGDEMTGYESMARYSGESFLNLGYEYWNLCMQHTKGLITFGSFIPGSKDLAYYLSNVHTYWFATVYGYLFVDFGPYIPLLFAFLLSISINKFIKKGFTISKLCLILYYYQLCYQIPFGWSFNALDVFMVVSMIILPYIVSKLFKI